jgi:YYY domain-containing protein
MEKTNIWSLPKKDIFIYPNTIIKKTGIKLCYWYRWVQGKKMGEIAYVVIWYLMVVFIGVISLPITISVCRSLPDTGHSVSKILGILFLAYISWILSYVIGYHRSEIILSLLLICLISGYIYIKYRPNIDRQLLLRNELIFGSIFLLFLLIRSFNPQINGGEKVNDFQLLNSILRSSSLPPHDAWLSGFRVNMYYYFGTFTIATLTKLTGIPGNIAYNLAMALIPALAANAAYGLGYNLTRSTKGGAIAMFLLAFAGNLYPAGIVLAHILGITRSPLGDVPEIIDFWSASRIIPFTINEFPYFSFIFGDLHAHMIALPFVLLAIMLILDIHYAKSLPWITFMFLGLSIGSLFVFNAWDYSTYAAFLILVLILRSIIKSSSVSGRINKIICILRGQSTGFLILLFGFLVFFMFFIDFRSSSIQGIKPVVERTHLINFLAIYGLFLFLIVSFMLVNLPELQYKNYLLVILLMLSISLYFVPNFQTLSVFVPLAFLSLINIYLFYRNNDPERLFVSIMIILGLSLLVFCELFYFDDSLGGTWERMNTVFKYYFQVWILWSIASAYAFIEVCKKKYRFRSAVLVTLSLLCVLNSIYLFTGTYAKTDSFSKNSGLDGIEFMKKTNFGYYDAIFWINININGTPIILEAPGSSYEDTSFLSAYTGLPTIIGWVNHELIWRNNWEELSQRINDVDTIYNTENYMQAYALLKKYNVTYVSVGDIELKRYRTEGLEKFKNQSDFEHSYMGYIDIYKIIK